jgi:Excalibur calcium-binding domain
MLQDRYPKFRQAQRHRGPFHRNHGHSSKRPLAFVPLLVGASALTFGGIYFSDRLPEALRAGLSLARSFERANTPQAGAYYAGCNDARAAGVAPIYADEPGYRPEMDGDSDGIACEPYRGR